jgi:hypothetical protein
MKWKLWHYLVDIMPFFFTKTPILITICSSTFSPLGYPIQISYQTTDPILKSWAKNTKTMMPIPRKKNGFP